MLLIDDVIKYPKKMKKPNFHQQYSMFGEKQDMLALTVATTKYFL